MSRFYDLITEAIEEFNSLAEKYKLNSRLEYINYTLFLCTEGQFGTNDYTEVIEHNNNQRVLSAIRGMISLVRLENSLYGGDVIE